MTLEDYMSNAHGNGHGSNHNGSGDAHAEESPVQKARSNFRTIDAIVNTLNTHHGTAYSEGMKHLYDADKDTYDVDKLQDPEEAMKVANKMADYLIDKARKALHVDKDAKLSSTDEARLLRAYAGTTRDRLKAQVVQSGKHFTHAAWTGDIAPTYVRDVSEYLQQEATAHVTKKDIESILDEMKIKDHVEVTEVRLNDITPLLRAYHAKGGVLSKEDVEDLPYAKKARTPAGAGH